MRSREGGDGEEGDDGANDVSGGARVTATSDFDESRTAPRGASRPRAGLTFSKSPSMCATGSAEEEDAFRRVSNREPDVVTQIGGAHAVVLGDLGRATGVPFNFARR